MLFTCCDKRMPNFAPMLTKTIIEVEGMTCSSCAQGISRQLNKEGLDNVEIDFESGIVEVELKSHFTNEQVMEMIRRLGYTARLPGDATSQKPNSFTNWISQLENKLLVALVFTVPLWLHMFIRFPVLHDSVFQLICCLPVFIIGYLHFGKSALGSIRTGHPNMDVLIMLGSAAAFFYSLYGTIFRSGADADLFLFYETSATIITFLLIGNLIEKRSLKKTQSAVEELTKIQPLKAHKIDNALTKDERIREIPANHLHIHDLILIQHGERVPAGGLIYEGTGVLDESMMTGESMPITKSINDRVLAGTILADGNLKVIVQKVSGDTVLSKMIETIKKSVNLKPAIQRTGDRVSEFFVPTVIIISVVVFLYYILLTDVQVSTALLRSIAILVISCPCAMGLATPTAVSVGIGRSARNGILVKGGDTLERLSSVGTIVFDKTGTLTTGKIRIKDEQFFKEAEFAKSLTGLMEQYSSHPFAKLLSELYSGKTFQDKLPFEEIREIPGKGVKAIVKGNSHAYFIGTREFTSAHDISDAFQVYLTDGHQTYAAWSFEDTIRPEAKQVISSLKQSGLKTVLLSGDKLEVCQNIARETGVEIVYAEKLPHEKALLIQELSAKEHVAMVGDGINDAAALASSSVGIAMGGGSDISIKTAEIVLLDKKDLFSLIAIRNLSKITLTTIRQNLAWALAYNIIAIPLAAMGYLNPIIASLSMAFSDVVVIGNSVRLNFRKLSGLQ